MHGMHTLSLPLWSLEIVSDIPLARQNEVNISCHRKAFWQILNRTTVLQKSCNSHTNIMTCLEPK